MSDNSYKQCGACRGSGKKSKGVQARIIDILEKTSLKRSIRKELEKSDEFANDVEELKEIIGSEKLCHFLKEDVFVSDAIRQELCGDVEVLKLYNLETINTVDQLYQRMAEIVSSLKSKLRKGDTHKKTFIKKYEAFWKKKMSDLSSTKGKKGNRRLASKPAENRITIMADGLYSPTFTGGSLEARRLMSSVAPMEPFDAENFALSCCALGGIAVGVMIGKHFVKR
jgi:hypothetical protein